MIESDSMLPSRSRLGGGKRCHLWCAPAQRKAGSRAARTCGSGGRGGGPPRATQSAAVCRQARAQGGRIVSVACLDDADAMARVRPKRRTRSPLYPLYGTGAHARFTATLRSFLQLLDRLTSSQRVYQVVTVEVGILYWVLTVLQTFTSTGSFYVLDVLLLAEKSHFGCSSSICFKDACNDNKAPDVFFFRSSILGFSPHYFGDVGSFFIVQFKGGR